MKLYLAGPDVFRPDAAIWAEKSRALCAEFGHEALIPLDAKQTTPAAIYQANVALIEAADAVLANLNVFRGWEPDSGTCFEVGFAKALKKRVIGYIDSELSMVDRAAGLCGGYLQRAEGRPVDAQGWFIEDFGLPLNLMLAVSTTVVVGGLREALDALTPNA